MIVAPWRWRPHWQMIANMLKDNYDNEISSDDVMIFNEYVRTPVSEIRQQYPGSRIIVYQAEPLLSRDHYWPMDVIISNIQDADEIWDYDYENFLYLEKLGLPVKWRPLMFSESVRHCSATRPKDIDVLVYGLFSERRGHWLSLLHMGMNPDKKIYTVCNVMHPEIDDLIDRSRVIVNWHQHPDQMQQEQTRISYLLANGKHVVSERSSINYYGDLIHEFTTRDEMIDQINHVLNTMSPDKELKIFSAYRHRTFDDWLQAAQTQLTKPLE